LVGQSRFQEAISIFDRLLEGDPDCIPALVGRARCQAMVENDEDAVKDLEKALSLGFDSIRLSMEIAGVYEALDQPFSACRYLLEAYYKDRENPEIRTRLHALRTRIPSSMNAKMELEKVLSFSRNPGRERSDNSSFGVNASLYR
jgi:tetratricopeptide (TPR) repeat protein